MIAIGVAAGGGTDGLVVIYGAVIVAGLVTFFVAPYFGKILRFFPPVVTGSVITIIGITLLQVAANDAIDTGTFDDTGNRILDPTDPKLLAYSPRHPRADRADPAILQGIHRQHRGVDRSGRRDRRCLLHG